MNELKSEVYLYQVSLFRAALIQSASPFQRENVAAAECHIRHGAQRFLVFRGLHTKIIATRLASGKQQCTNTNASIVVSFGATRVKCQPPQQSLLPEHSSHVKFRAMGFTSLFGWLGRRWIEAIVGNEYPSFL